MKFTTAIIATAVGVSAAPASQQATGPTYYLIRHAEKNGDGTISSQGMKREQCLVNLFGKGSSYNIQHIFTQDPHPGDARSQRPYNTTLPLANNLGITIEHPCDYTDVDCAAKALQKFETTATGNILVAWEHIYLPKIANAIGTARNAPSNPSDHFDYIYQLPPPYSSVTVGSEHCPGLDK